MHDLGLFLAGFVPGTIAQAIPTFCKSAIGTVGKLLTRRLRERVFVTKALVQLLKWKYDGRDCFEGLDNFTLHFYNRKVN